MRSVWVEAAVNGPWSRARQPGIPVSVEEIVADGIACAEAGAAIVHVHPYDEATGLQRDDPDIYEPILRGIRAETDAIVYPTLPLSGAPGTPPMTAEERFAAVTELARRGLLEWTVVDPGSVNVSHVDTPGESFVYLNPHDHVRHGLALCAEYGIRPAYACYEPGFTRLGAGLAATFGARRRAAVVGLDYRDGPCRPGSAGPTGTLPPGGPGGTLPPGGPGGTVAGRLPDPVYRFMFSDDLRFGFPPERYALEAHRRLLHDLVPSAEWMVAGLCVDITPLIPDAVSLGGHVRVGLEDAPFGCDRTNPELVRDAVARIEALGAGIATPADVRAELNA